MNKKENKSRTIVKGVGKSSEEARKYESNSEDERKQQPKKLKILSLFRNSQESSEDDKRMKKLNIRTVKELDKETKKKTVRKTAAAKRPNAKEEKTKGASTYTVLSTYTQMQPPTENDFEDENMNVSPCPTNINVVPAVAAININPTHAPILNLLYKLGLEHSEVMKEQWKRIDTKIEIKASDCQAYNENKNWNQEKDKECLDINRVKINDGYVHASYFETKEIPRKFILSQIPIEESKKIAAFWSMIYQENLKTVYVLCSADEKISGIFPISNSGADSVKFGNLQVRKIEDFSEDLHCFDIYKSDSPFRTKIQFLNDWPENGVAKNTKKLVTVLTNVVDDLQQNNIAIVSRRGTGRAATFLAISYGCYLTKNGTNFNLKKICRAIRKQRPGAISNYLQFVFIYSMIFQFSLQNMTDLELKTRTQKTIQDIDLILKNE
ncbi:unnamed protein product [Caenorhabditis angaria]|uniref:Tyrosine-protein phosphatase domain-containing protein n=1 Tax=Caenorhabditis angaria TaxID=860376 RepID=A0A9P1MZE6_9PELO|nr:unnamed protein product [Caenorhabditis angaria]